MAPASDQAVASGGSTAHPGRRERCATTWPTRVRHWPPARSAATTWLRSPMWCRPSGPRTQPRLSRCFSIWLDATSRRSCDGQHPSCSHSSTQQGAERALKNAYEKRGLKLSVVGHHGYLKGVFDVESTELLRAALQPLMRPSGAGDRRGITQLRADALLDLAQHSLDTAVQPELGNQRPQLSVVVDAERLKSGRGGVGLPWTGAVVPAAVARRWACDAEISGVVASVLPPPRAIPLMLGSSPDLPQITGGWLPLDVGRASRLATTGQVKALRVRDGGCVHPGCPRTAAYCHAHHVTHWADGGGTDLSNLVLLCRHHHRSLHDGVWRLRADPDRPGRFMASTPAGWTAAQTAADRSPPMRQRPPTLATVSRE